MDGAWRAAASRHNDGDGGSDGDGEGVGQGGDDAHGGSGGDGEGVGQAGDDADGGSDGDGDGVGQGGDDADSESDGEGDGDRGSDAEGDGEDDDDELCVDNTPSAVDVVTAVTHNAADALKHTVPTVLDSMVDVSGQVHEHTPGDASVKEDAGKGAADGGSEGDVPMHEEAVIPALKPQAQPTQRASRGKVH